jgi:hypothetical protein
VAMGERIDTIFFSFGAGHPPNYEVRLAVQASSV